MGAKRIWNEAKKLVQPHQICQIHACRLLLYLLSDDIQNGNLNSTSRDVADTSIDQIPVVLDNPPRTNGNREEILEQITEQFNTLQTGTQAQAVNSFGETPPPSPAEIFEDNVNKHVEEIENQQGKKQA